METLQVVKIGGNIVNNDQLLADFMDDFCTMNDPKILIHGGGNVASEISDRLGVQPTMHEGRRITDADSLEVVTMVYAGLINKQLTSKLQAHGCNALGLTGADLNIVRATKRDHPTIDFGFVGDVETKDIDVTTLGKLLNIGAVPVFCAITHDGKGQLYNTNADTLASVIARALVQQFDVNLTYCFGFDGVMRNVDDPDSIISEIKRDEFQGLKEEGVIKDGMIPKLENAFKAAVQGVSKVYIKNAAHILNNRGTRISS